MPDGAAPLLLSERRSLPVTPGVVIAPEPFSPRVEVLPASPGESVRQLLGRAIRAGVLDPADLCRTHVFADGERISGADPAARRVALERRIRDGETIHLAVLPAGGGGRGGGGSNALEVITQIAFIALSVWVAGPAGPLAALGQNLGATLVRTAAAAAVTVAGGLVSNTLFGRPAQDGAAAARDRYSLDGAQNQARIRQSMPLILGQRRVTFDLASSAYTSTVDDDSFIHVIFGVHYGPCTVTELKLGETLVSALPAGDVEIESFLTPGPRAFTLYPMRTVQESYSDALKPDEGDAATPVVHTSADEAERLELDVAFPQGLYYTDEKGHTTATDTHLLVEWRPYGGSSWTAAPLPTAIGLGGALPAGSLYVKANSRDPLRRTYGWDCAKGRYDLRVTWISAYAGTSGGADPTAQVANAVYWTALRSIEHQAPIVDQTLSVIAMRIRAGSTINGQLAPVSGLVAPHAPFWDGEAWQDAIADWQPSSNAAALTRMLMMGPAAAKPLTASQIDGSIDTVRALIETYGWTGALTVADGSSQRDALNRLGRMGRFSTYWNGTKLCFVPDWQKPAPRQLFTARNAQGYRYKRSFPDAVHGVLVQFGNLDQDSRADELMVYADGFDSNTATLVETLQLEFACAQARAHREGRVYLAKRALQVESHEWTTSPEGIASTYGDRVRLRHAASLFGLAEARVQNRRWAGGLVTGVRLDQPVRMEAGKYYGIDARRADGLKLGLAVDTAAGETRELTFTTPLAEDQAPRRGDLLAFGEANLVTEDLEIVDFAPQGDRTVQIVARNYRADDIVAAETGPVPPLQTRLSARAAAPTPVIIGVQGSPDGVVLAFTVDPQRTSPIAGFTARWRRTPGSGEASNWVDLPGLQPTARLLRTPPFPDATAAPGSIAAPYAVDIELRSVLANGDRSQPAQALNVTITKGVPRPTALTATGAIRVAADGSSFPVLHVSANALTGGLAQDLIVEVAPPGTAEDSPSWVSAGQPLPAANPVGDFRAVSAGATYDVRARWRNADNWLSAWVTVADVAIPANSTVASGIVGMSATEVIAKLLQALQAGDDLSDAVMEVVASIERNRALSEARAFIGAQPIGSFVLNEQTRTDELVQTMTLFGVKGVDGDVFYLDFTKLMYDADETLGEHLEQLAFDIGAVSAAITSEASIRGNADTLQAQTTALIGAAKGDMSGFVVDQSKLYWDSGTLLTSKLSSIQSQIGSDIASYDSLIKAWVDSSSASVTWINNLEASFGGFSGHISALTTIVAGPSGLMASNTLALDVDGHVIGTYTVNDGITGGITHVVDYFNIVTIGGVPRQVFSAAGSVIKMADVEVDTLKVGSASDRLGYEDLIPVACPTGAGEFSIGSLPYTTGKSGVAIVFLTVEYDTSGSALPIGVDILLKRDGTLLKHWNIQAPLDHGDSRVFAWMDVTLPPGSYTYEAFADAFSGGDGFQKLSATIFVLQMFA